MKIIDAQIAAARLFRLCREQYDKNIIYNDACYKK